MPGSTYMAKGCLYIYSWIFLYTYKGKLVLMNKEPLGNYRSLSASVMIIKVMCYHVPLFRFFIFLFQFFEIIPKNFKFLQEIFFENH